MKIARSSEIPHQLFRPFFDYWSRQRDGRPWPRRADITLDCLRSAAANTAFCRVETPYRDLDSLIFTNVGTHVELATGQQITGATVGQLLRNVGSSPEFTRCFSEYGLVATEGGCTYNEGRFPWPDHTWLAYRRLVMALGEGDSSGDLPSGLFVVVDLNAEGLGLTLPETLREREGAEATPSHPWSDPALRLRRGNAGARTGNGLLD